MKHSKKTQNISKTGFILSLIGAILFLAPYIGTILLILGVIFSIKELKMSKNTLSIIGLIIGISFLIPSLILTNTDFIKNNPTTQIQKTLDINSYNLLISGNDLPTTWQYKLTKYTEDINNLTDSQNLKYITNEFKSYSAISAETIGANITHKIYKFNSPQNAQDFYSKIVNSIKENRGYEEYVSNIGFNSFYISKSNYLLDKYYLYFVNDNFTHILEFRNFSSNNLDLKNIAKSILLKTNS